MTVFILGSKRMPCGHNFQLGENETEIKRRCRHCCKTYRGSLVPASWHTRGEVVHGDVFRIEWETIAQPDVEGDVEVLTIKPRTRVARGATFKAKRKR